MVTEYGERLDGVSSRLGGRTGGHRHSAILHRLERIPRAGSRDLSQRVLRHDVERDPELAAAKAAVDQAPDAGGVDEGHRAQVDLDVSGAGHADLLQRVDQLRAAAGVDLTGVNLARKVTDGEMIAIGVTPPPVPNGGGPASAGGPVNLNTATAAELQTLPGIGEVLAQRIIDFRAAHGGFRAVGDLRQVEGIGDAKYQSLKDRVAV